MTRKPESQLTFKDHEPVKMDGPVKVGRHSFHVGDKVTASDRFRQTVVGDIIRFERMDTKTSATAEVTYRKTPVYYATVQYQPNVAVVLDVRKLAPAHPDMVNGRA